MKNIKRLVLGIVVIFLSGCSVDYKLTINNDLSVNETIVATEYTKQMDKKTNLKGEEAVNYLYDMFRRNDSNETMFYNEDGVYTIATVNESYSSLSDFKDKFFSDLFDPLTITEKDNEITLSAPQIKKLGNVGSRNLLYDEVKITIEVPYKVTNSNADSVYGNKYVWNIKENEDLKKIELTFDSSRSNESFIVKVRSKNVNIKYSYILAGVFVITISAIILIVSINNKKNNKV